MNVSCSKSLFRNRTLGAYFLKKLLQMVISFLDMNTKVPMIHT